MPPDSSLQRRAPVRARLLSDEASPIPSSRAVPFHTCLAPVATVLEAHGAAR